MFYIELFISRLRLLVLLRSPFVLHFLICSRNIIICSAEMYHIYGPFEFRTSLGPSILLFALSAAHTNTLDKETSFFNLNIKVIGSDIHTSVYNKRDDFGFPIVNFPWLSGDVPRLPSYGIYISQLVRIARCCTSVLGFHSKNLRILQHC